MQLAYSFGGGIGVGCVGYSNVHIPSSRLRTPPPPRHRTDTTLLNIVSPVQVINSLTSGVTINMVGLGSAVIGLQATTGLLFAKTLSVAAQNPYLSGGAYNPVLALDIFLVQAAANVLLAHFLGAAVSLWLLRTICD